MEIRSTCSHSSSPCSIPPIAPARHAFAFAGSRTAASSVSRWAPWQFGQSAAASRDSECAAHTLGLTAPQLSLSSCCACSRLWGLGFCWLGLCLAMLGPAVSGREAELTLGDAAGDIRAEPEDQHKPRNQFEVVCSFVQASTSPEHRSQAHVAKLLDSGLEAAHWWFAKCRPS